MRLPAVVASTCTLLLGLFVGSAVSEPLFQNINPAGTYLFVDTTASIPDVKVAPTTVAIDSLNLSTKRPVDQQYIGLQNLGAFQAGLEFADNADSMNGVFSSEAGLLSPGEGGNFNPVSTLPSDVRGLPTDIPQDFTIPHRSSQQLAVVRIPVGATSIQFSPNDSFFRDNSDPNGDYRVKIVTLQDVINNDAITLDKDCCGIGSMGAAILPQNGITIQQAAQLGGYDHFNWLQRITKFEFEGEVRSSIEPFGLSFLGREIGLDPLIGGNPWSLADSEDLYFDETPVLFRSDYFIQNGENQVFFRDSPNLIEKGWTAYFETHFVGVRSDGSYDILSTILDDADELTFRWKYTQTVDFCPQFLCSESGVVGVLQNIDPLLGGLGEVEFIGFGFEPTDTIPEPSSAAILGLTLIAWLCRARAGKSVVRNTKPRISGV